MVFIVTKKWYQLCTKVTVDVVLPKRDSDFVFSFLLSDPEKIF